METKTLLKEISTSLQYQYKVAKCLFEETGTGIINRQEQECADARGFLLWDILDDCFHIVLQEIASSALKRVVLNSIRISAACVQLESPLAVEILRKDN